MCDPLLSDLYNCHLLCYFSNSFILLHTMYASILCHHSLQKGVQSCLPHTELLFCGITSGIIVNFLYIYIYMYVYVYIHIFKVIDIYFSLSKSQEIVQNWNGDLWQGGPRCPSQFLFPSSPQGSKWLLKFQPLSLYFTLVILFSKRLSLHSCKIAAISSGLIFPKL